MYIQVELGYSFLSLHLGDPFDKWFQQDNKSCDFSPDWAPFRGPLYISDIYVNIYVYIYICACTYIYIYTHIDITLSYMYA